MANPVTRRPLPALLSLVALLLLTGLVWWRVLHRNDTPTATPNPCPSSSAAPAVTLPSPASVTVVVLNSTSRSGIASRARTILSADGFNVPTEAGNDSAAKRNKITGTAEIRFGPRGRSAARLLYYYFPGAKLVPGNSPSSTVVVSLGTRYTSVAPAAAVSRSLAAGHVTLAAPTPTPVGTASTTPSASRSC